MQSPPIELVLDVLHIGSRNLLRNAGDPDQDTISEITRGVVERIGPFGPLVFTGVLVGAGVVFHRHILKPLGLPLFPLNIDLTNLTGD